MRGYIAMLAVREGYRGRGIATELVRKTLDVMIERDADEVLHHRPSVNLRADDNADRARDRGH